MRLSISKISLIPKRNYTTQASYEVFVKSLNVSDEEKTLLLYYHKDLITKERMSIQVLQKEIQELLLELESLYSI